MKKNLLIRKAATSLLIPLLLILSIPVKSFAQITAHVPYYPASGHRISYGIETMAIDAEQLRAAARANSGDGTVANGYAVVALRVYLALPPGSVGTGPNGFDIEKNGFTLGSGCQQAYIFVNIDDTSHVLFGYGGSYYKPEHHGVRQPTTGDAPNIPANIFMSSTMKLMAGIPAAGFYNGGTSFNNARPTTYSMSFTPAATEDASYDGGYGLNCYTNGGDTDYDTIYIRRLTFVIHDVEKFITNGGFQVVGDNAIGYGTGSIMANTSPSQRRMYIDGSTRQTGYKINCSGTLANEGWLMPGTCMSIIDLTPGGVVVITKPSPKLPKIWRPCPTYTTA